LLCLSVLKYAVIVIQSFFSLIPAPPYIMANKSAQISKPAKINYFFTAENMRNRGYAEENKLLIANY